MSNVEVTRPAVRCVTLGTVPRVVRFLRVLDNNDWMQPPDDHSDQGDWLEVQPPDGHSDHGDRLAAKLPDRSDGGAELQSLLEMDTDNRRIGSREGARVGRRCSSRVRIAALAAACHTAPPGTGTTTPIGAGVNPKGEVFLVHAWPPINETANIRVPGYPEAIAYPQDEREASRNRRRRHGPPTE
eukprot:m51a1_g9295 hypothetical protein (185) ;mRNA; f:39491-44427